ncbi:MAG: peptidylprolyl isomerase [Planctomycetota bacterium]
MRTALAITVALVAAPLFAASAVQEGPEGPAPQPPAVASIPLPPGAVATVNAEPISEKEWLENLRRMAGKGVLDVMIRRMVVKQEAARLGIKVSDSELQAIFDKKIVEAGGISKLEAYLKPVGESLSDYRQRLHSETLLRRIAEKDVIVTEDDLKKFYLEMYGRKAEVQAIVVQSEDIAKATLARLKAGEDFGQVAREVSIDRTTAQYHGYIPVAVTEGVFPKNYGNIVMTQAQAEQIFSLPAGGMTGVVPGAGGAFYIFKLARLGGPSNEKFEDVKEKVRASAMEYKIQARGTQILQNLISSAVIKTAL